jgi:hypothetical protein
LKDSHARGIDISMIDHVQKGQMTKRFLLAKKEAPGTKDATTMRLLGDESTSLSIIYRARAYLDPPSLQTPLRNSGKGGKETSASATTSNKDVSAQPKKPLCHRFETLDLVVPSPRDYGNLLTALEDLLTVYREERKHYDPSVLLMQHHWVDMDKDLKDTMHVNEWIELCGHMNVPLKKPHLFTLFKDLAKDLEMEEAGLPLWIVAELMNDVRYYSLEAVGIKYINQDPMLRLWKEIKGTDPVPSLRVDDKPEKEMGGTELEVNRLSDDKTISSVAFLSFVRSQQKEFKTTLEDALGLLHVLNEQISVKKIALEEDGEDEEEDLEMKLTARDRLNKTTFLSYLLSDANDLVDPEKGKVGADDMNLPLSHYWINTSHDTYLSQGAGPNGGGVKLDEQMYLAALYRGVRCLELDVWDGLNLVPVIARSKPKTPEDPVMDVSYVLRAIRQFLLAHPHSYPVILNIENHCSYTGQENLADLMFQILGSIGLIVVPDESESIDESDLLPSPESMKGKVIVMGKRPRLIRDGAKVINDDFDDENAEYHADELPNARSIEEEHQMEDGIVIGFDAAGPIRSLDPSMAHNMVRHSPGELVFMAKEEAEQARIEAARAELRAVDVADEAEKAEYHAKEIIEEAGLTTEDVFALVNYVKAPELDPVGHATHLKRAEGEGVEISEFFGDAVEGAKTNYCDADAEALQAAVDATEALQELNDATEKLREAETALGDYHAREKKVHDASARGKMDARLKREYADTAQRRVETVRQLLVDCEDGAMVAENVVVTAMTEAKISEKRAIETEARAARAQEQAKRDRRRADEDSKREEDLETQASEYHDACVAATAAYKENKERLSKATTMLERITEQIKLIEQSSHFKKEMKEMYEHVHEQKDEIASPRTVGKFVAKHAAKLEEMKMCVELIQRTKAETKMLEERKRQASDAFESKAHQWKSQADVASKARKQANRASHTAEELAEHADEEREAANLRLVARDRAQNHVAEKDSTKISLRAQLAEAERAANEANNIALEARKEAERLEGIAESLESHDDAVRAFERRKAKRDKILAIYEKKKAIKELTESRVLEAKRLFDTSTEVFSSAMRDAAKEMTRANVQELADRNAIVAFNRARLARKQADHALEVAKLAQSVVTEKECAIRRAEEYKEKTDRITVIPVALAKMTFLHTTKHRYWEKSLELPSTHAHSFAQGVVDEMTMRDPNHAKMMREFTMDRMCRTFASWKDKNPDGSVNFDPIFQWSMGCQLVAMNYSTFDEHVLKADGRFRGNGSCGYVLKPEFLIAENESAERPQNWQIHVLSGNCLPSTKSTSRKANAANISYINPFVRITIYEGQTDSGRRTKEYRTRVVEKNGLNPVWDDKKGFDFTVVSPKMSILAFTVWDQTESGTEEIIAAASMPVACIREGYRNVALFDVDNSRAGPYAFASLFVSAKKVTA